MITFNNTGAYCKEQEAISLEEIQKMRSSPVGWAILCHHLLPAVAGTTTWDQKVAVQKITEFTMDSDVAFCLLALEKNWDYWVKVASIEDDSNTHDIPYNEMDFESCNEWREYWLEQGRIAAVQCVVPSGGYRQGRKFSS
jgi:hypothetical protein